MTKSDVRNQKPLTFPTILLGTMIRNEGHALDRWWQSLCDLNYPKDKIKLSVIDDASTDNTLARLDSFRKMDVFGEFTLATADSLPYATLRKSKIRYGSQWWRVDEWNAWHNEYWFRRVREGAADHFLQVHGDVMIHPEALNDYIYAVTTLDKVGWVGSIGKNRGGRSLVAWKWRHNDGENMERYEVFSRSNGIVQVIKRILGGLVVPMSLDDFPEDSHFFECAFVGGCFLINGEVLRLGCEYAPWSEEQAVPFALRMQRLGYHALCSTETPMVHINDDGSEERV